MEDNEEELRKKLEAYYSPEWEAEQQALYEKELEEKRQQRLKNFWECPRCGHWESDDCTACHNWDFAKDMGPLDGNIVLNPMIRFSETCTLRQVTKLYPRKGQVHIPPGKHGYVCSCFLCMPQFSEPE